MPDIHFPIDYRRGLEGGLREWLLWLEAYTSVWGAP